MDIDTVKLTVRIPADLVEIIDRVAVERDRSRNWTIVDLIRRSATHHPQPAKEHTA